MELNLEWLEAQKIDISIDIVSAAKQQLKFLEVVDKNLWLYKGPIVDRAIYRYNAYWLPLLAKYTESSSICEGPLALPLDCEWVWHCHRLNPVRYKSDCEKFYGRLLDNSGVVSSVNGNCKLQTENLWKILYPTESYDLDLDKVILEHMDLSALENCTTYDLLSAIKRQSQLVPQSSGNADIEKRIARYKACVYLAMKNQEKSIEPFTFDIDLIWHTHQLNPSSYTNDLGNIFDNILHHIGSNPDLSKGNKLDIGFSKTIAQWEESQSYWEKSSTGGCGNMLKNDANENASSDDVAS